MQKTGIYSEIPDDSPDITFSSSQITMIKRLDGIIRQILLRVVAAIPLFKSFEPWSLKANRRFSILSPHFQYATVLSWYSSPTYGHIHHFSLPIRYACRFQQALPAA